MDQPDRWLTVLEQGRQLSRRTGGAEREARFIDRLIPLIDSVESPIEALLLTGLAWFSDDTAIEPQQWIGRDRVDFLISFDGHSLAIEADGHDFHEKTKVQAQHDKARDRRLLLAGYPVVRFTGQEIYADPYLAAAEALDILERMVGRQIA